MTNRYTQDNRLISVDTPLGKDVLLLAGFHGKESLSRLFSFELKLLSENHSISFDEIIGRPVSITLRRDESEERYFHGIIAQFEQYAGKDVTAQRLSSYHATMVPWTWLLTRTTDSRIFQNKSVPDIIEQIFREKGFSDYRLAVQEQHETRVYCVQYRETDFNFISRLMEDEGIYYYFVHEADKHTMVIADTPGRHQRLSRTIPYQRSFGGRAGEDTISELHKSQEIQAGKYTLYDFNFEIPRTKLDPNVDSQQTLGPGEREMYDYPGGFTSKAAGDRVTRIRMEEEEARITLISGVGDCRDFTSGYRFTLSNAFRSDMDQDYVLTTVEHSAVQGFEGESETTYSNRFLCIPYSVPFRPPRITPKPVVHGSQTATVVGPSGEEIHTDNYGRIIVQFHWDREGQRNQDSSCWVRVASGFAGGQFGSIFIPRIGQEVIVDFLEGDPDKPIVTGRVYNNDNMPPYTLPDEKTKSTIKTNSSKGGGGFNEIRFEDKKGSEQVFIHAESRQDNRVKGDSLEFVGHDRHLIVKNDQFEKVEGDKHLKVLGDQNGVVVGSVSLKSRNFDFDVANNYRLKSSVAIDIKSVITVLEASTAICLRVGGSFVTISSAGVDILGPRVNINSGGSVYTSQDPRCTNPIEPKEADSGKPGQQVTSSGGGSSTQPSSQGGAPPSAQAQCLAEACASGSPNCEV